MQIICIKDVGIYCARDEIARTPFTVAMITATVRAILREALRDKCMDLNIDYLRILYSLIVRFFQF